MQPLIGITGRPKYIESVGAPLRAYSVFHTYTDGVLAAGAIPVMLIPTDDELIDPVLDRIDGLIMTGGGDVSPEMYGDSDHGNLVNVDGERDRFEIALAKKALARKMPTFAICRGLQIVNVALGGTLVQDLPSERGAEGHDVIGDFAYLPHSTVDLEPGCRIAAIIGEGPQGVNSLHHQAVDQLGDGLRVVGRADDGTIEAIEHDDPDWPMVAVQWHPEFLRVRDHGASQTLFEAFVEMAEKYRADH
jgi:putative glutamine amidotransferase